MYLDIMVLGSSDDVVVVKVPGGTNSEAHNGCLVPPGQFTDRVELTEIPDTNLNNKTVND